jgi:hypothetical protein
MFKYISKILAQFSTSQKIVALSILLLSIVIISIAPSIISSVTLDRDELNSEIKRQDTKIKKLEIHADSLEYKIRKSGMECTNQIVLREEEFLEMLENLKGDLRNHNNIEDRIVRLNTTTEKKIYPISTVGDSSVSMMMVREEPRQEKVIIYKKPQISSTLSLIDEMERKIKKN